MKLKNQILNIAICDDEMTQIRQIKNNLEAYLQNRSELSVQIQTFRSGKELLKRVEDSGGFDLYFLDVVMPELNGIETGHCLRKVDETGEIIYLSISGDYAVDSYDVRAFFYLLKPIEKRRMFEVLDAVIEKLERRCTAVLVSTVNGLRRIFLKEILYVERVGRRLRYYCVNGQVDSLSIRVPFHEAVTPLLNELQFYQCGASYVFNFQHVIGIKKQTALLDNGQSVLLPRAAVTEFKNAWGNYWLKEEV